MELFLGFDLTALIRTVGLAGLFAIVFAESGLLIGFFLPGDSLLFTAGFLASQGYFNIWILVAGCFVAAVLGDNVGYAFGRRMGRRIFERSESLLFNPKNLDRAEWFYEQYGASAVVLARWLPAIRTFAPIVAGVGLMRYRRFLAANIIGAGLWAIGMPLLGYFLGSVIPGADRYLIPIVAAIIILSLLPPLIAGMRDPDRRRAVMSYFRENVLAYPPVRRGIGIALIVFGLVALALPFFPFAWVGLVGLKLLGVPLPFENKFRSWWWQRVAKPMTELEEVSEREVIRNWAVAEVASTRRAPYLQGTFSPEILSKVHEGRLANLSEEEWGVLEGMIRRNRHELLDGLLPLGVKWYKGVLPVKELLKLKMISWRPFVDLAKSNNLIDLVRAFERGEMPPHHHEFSENLRRIQRTLNLQEMIGAPIVVSRGELPPYYLIEGFTRCSAMSLNYRKGIFSGKKIPVILGVSERIHEWSFLGDHT